MSEENDSEAKASIIVEIREEEQMVDPTSFNANLNPTLIRTAYFLKPSLNPIHSSPPSPPNIHPLSVSLRLNNVNLSSSSIPLKGWPTWVHDLEQTHGPLWHKAGIFDAIKGSTYHIPRNSDLLFRLAERWCPETNTFVFPWGEASVTLEDVFVLGGFSPLGDSVLSGSSLGDDVKRVENKLIESYRELWKIDHNVIHVRWQERFMGCGNEIEHAGFLALWLARHVFPTRSCYFVTRANFSMAARLSFGDKLAFGPAILASIYRDLTLLKRTMMDCHDNCTVVLSSPLHLVQIWAWERFLLVGPVPRVIGCGETRLARWETHVKKIKDKGVLLDLARDTFRWRPYGMSLENCPFPRFYVDSGTWVTVDSDEKWKMIATFLTVSQLVGLDCIERYNPNRVALQFGYDQDIPDDISRFEYQNDLIGLKLYIPHRLHEGDVTLRYSNWLKRLNPVAETLVGCNRKTRTKNRVKNVSKTCGSVNQMSCVLNTQCDPLDESIHPYEVEHATMMSIRSYSEPSDNEDSDAKQMIKSPAVIVGVKEKSGKEVIELLCKELEDMITMLETKVSVLMAAT